MGLLLVQKISRGVQQPHIWVTEIVNGTDDFKFAVGIWVPVYTVWDPVANESTIQSILAVCVCVCVCACDVCERERESVIA